MRDLSSPQIGMNSTELLRVLRVRLATAGVRSVISHLLAIRPWYARIVLPVVCQKSAGWFKGAAERQLLILPSLGRFFCGPFPKT